MVKGETPPWLKRMDNGAIGEARTKAFLMDRFWILERSVDIDGADFIIQRKITAANLLDPRPPRFGVVQVKFFMDQSTTQYIHKEYLVDQKGQPRDEFFVACHTGTENEATVYVMSARDVTECFDEVKAGLTQEGKYAIPGRVLCGGDRFKVISPKLTLDRIERAMEQADFQNNRFFLSWALPSVDADLKKIDPIYLEPIENWWGDIPSEFFKFKEKATRVLWRIEELYDEFKEMVETSDPERALSIAERAGENLCLPDDLYNEDFMSAVQEHKEKYQNLKAAGKLDQFISLHQCIVKVVADDLGPKMPLERDDALVVEINYDPSNLNESQIRTNYVKKDEISLPAKPISWPSVPELRAILKSSPGSISAYEIPGAYAHRRAETTPWNEYLMSDPPFILSTIMDQIYDHLFPADRK